MGGPGVSVGKGAGLTVLSGRWAGHWCGSFAVRGYKGTVVVERCC